MSCIAVDGGPGLCLVASENPQIVQLAVRRSDGEFAFQQILCSGEGADTHVSGVSFPGINLEMVNMEANSGNSGQRVVILGGL